MGPVFSSQVHGYWGCDLGFQRTSRSKDAFPLSALWPQIQNVNMFISAFYLTNFKLRNFSNMNRNRWNSVTTPVYPSPRSSQ